MLDAAVKRIASEGIDDVRIARIAMDAGVSPALVHYHFESREALLAEALEHSYERAGDARIAALDDGAPAAYRLRVMIDQCLPLPGALRDDWLLWAELWLRASRHPELRETAARLYARMREWFAEVIADGIARGEFTPCDTGRDRRPADRADRRLRHPRADGRSGDAGRSARASRSGQPSPATSAFPRTLPSRRCRPTEPRTRAGLIPRAPRARRSSGDAGGRCPDRGRRA